MDLSMQLSLKISNPFNINARLQIFSFCIYHLNNIQVFQLTKAPEKCCVVYCYNSLNHHADRNLSVSVKSIQLGVISLHNAMRKQKVFLYLFQSMGVLRRVHVATLRGATIQKLKICNFVDITLIFVSHY